MPERDLLVLTILLLCAEQLVSLGVFLSSTHSRLEFKNIQITFYLKNFHTYLAADLQREDLAMDLANLEKHNMSQTERKDE